MVPYSRYTMDAQSQPEDDEPEHYMGGDGQTVEDWRTSHRFAEAGPINTLPSYGSSSQYRSFDGAPIYEPRGSAS